MNSAQVAVVVEYGIMILGGVYATLVGFRVINASKRQGQDVEDWHKKYGKMLKILGPLMIVFGVILLVHEYPR